MVIRSKAKLLAADVKYRRFDSRITNHAVPGSRLKNVPHPVPLPKGERFSPFSPWEKGGDEGNRAENLFLRHALVSGLGPEIAFAVDGLDRNLFDSAAAQHVQRNIHTRLAAPPQLVVEIGLALDRLAANTDDYIARAYAGVFSGALRGDARDDYVALDFLGIDPDPRTRTGGRLPGSDEVAQQGLQQVYRHEQVARDPVARAHCVIDHEGTNTQQLAFPAEERRAAPIHRCRRGIDRLVELVLPVADERPARHHVGRCDAVVPDDQHELALADGGGLAKLDRPDRQRPQRLEQTETRGIVVTHYRGGKTAAVRSRELDRLGLDDEIANGEDQPFGIDHHPGTLALRAQRAAGARIGNHLTPHPDHRKRVDGEIRLGPGLNRGRRVLRVAANRGSEADRERRTRKGAH